MIDIKLIWASQTPTDEIIIKTRLEEILPCKCFAATDHIAGNYIFIIETSKNAKIPEFKNFKFKGLLIQVFDFTDYKELNIYLLDNQLKDIFSLFIENILDEIADCVTENEALIETSNVVLKWKKLFDKINFQGLTLENQKGLIGELLLINSFLDEKFPIENLLESWTGPDYEDKDFLFGSKGIEVKFTSSKTPKIRITSERQLDSQNLSHLYLILFVAEQVKDRGFSLNSIVEQIRNRISSNHNALKFFNERLIVVGYSDEDFENYNSQYALKMCYKYSVENDFPKIISSDLASGIYNASYYIELSAIETFKLNVESFIELVN
ncbi:PD-(D/E)XK motif protein [Flavobacterium hibernum]|uniref:PD-(D/E)XK motif protein n=1 Tax=Flavobacterium hibernum TaxID=37752 RepID=A0A0D0EFN6_9FLAO|nr:PD-(D/E)XK motif protein [Flavobacterium hibernum]KIO54419.1 hypothetical protein IW18_02940 [Flavobacterium hibernum]OXA88109.1 hypothetical protein B0A73_10050 [Flavobacterium hibernum]STO10724.1 Uncharacterised protein [Flavobacterium hibernum]